MPIDVLDVIWMRCDEEVGIANDSAHRHSLSWSHQDTKLQVGDDDDGDSLPLSDCEEFS